MRILLAAVAAAFFLLAGQLPASAATAGQALVQKPSYSQNNALIEKTHWRHHHWRRHHRRWYYYWWW